MNIDPAALQRSVADSPDLAYVITIKRRPTGGTTLRLFAQIRKDELHVIYDRSFNPGELTSGALADFLSGVEEHVSTGVVTKLGLPIPGP